MLILFSDKQINNQKGRTDMKQAFNSLLILICIFSISMTSCGQENPKQENEPVSNSSTSFDKPLCQILLKEDIQNLTGLTFNEVTETVHSYDKASGKYVSQCAYYTGKGIQHIAVLLSHIKNYAYPTSIDKMLSSSKVGDPELDVKIDEAIETSKKVDGLGDAAYWYSLFNEAQMSVVVNKNYQILITSHGLSFDNTTLEMFKKVAQKIISLINE